MSTVQEPIIEKAPGGPSETVERHPAYAQIGVNRVSGKAHLYGSDFTHHYFMMISIRASELHRGLSADWPFGREEYIEVALSEAQWATFVSSPNVGQGVQCTLIHRDGKQVPELPRPKPRTDQFKGEMGETFQDACVALMELRKRITEGRGGKESLSLLDKALRELNSNVPYVAEQFSEHMEHTVEKAKSEVNAYAQHLITRLGLQAANVPLALEEEKQP